jgi:triphosphoribosyl-dephospho-CoA synthetase
MWTTPSTVGSVGRLIKKGSLGVEMVDREKQQLVWAGAATGKAKEKRTDKMKQLDKVLTKMMDQYPPPRATK